jgi:predicted nucleic acid-binding protein
MPNIFVDTSGGGNLIDISQPYHHPAVQIYQKITTQKYQLITTNYIVVELVALLSSPLHIPRNKIIAFVNGLKQSSYVKIIHIDSTIDDLTWQLLVKRQDKDWSLVDCSSFIVMEQYKLTEALTTDHHFEQAGFIRLLKF